MGLVGEVVPENRQFSGLSVFNFYREWTEKLTEVG